MFRAAILCGVAFVLLAMGACACAVVAPFPATAAGQNVAAGLSLAFLLSCLAAGGLAAGFLVAGLWRKAKDWDA